jgi:hypothetical protein
MKDRNIPHLEKSLETRSKERQPLSFHTYVIIYVQIYIRKIVLSMLYSSCFGNMPIVKKNLQGFFLHLLVFLSKIHTHSGSLAGCFGGPKYIFQKYSGPASVSGHMPHTFGVSVYFSLAGILPAIRELIERTPAAKGRGGKNIVTDKTYVLTRYEGRYKG